MKNCIFQELNLSKEVQKAIAEMGFEEATPIQSQSIPLVLKGKDVTGLAQTGTGKTCAFGIPAIEMIQPNIFGIQVLVLCPTRELAVQTAEELKNVAKYKRGIKILPVYGGQPIERQIMALKSNPQIIIGTPGRIMDHMRRRTLKLMNLKLLILDEADEMLNMGFREDIDTILEEVPDQKQTILFSATMSGEIKELTHKYQKSPVFIKVNHQELTVPNIEQVYLEVRESNKPDMLSRLIDAYELKLSLVFCNTKKRVDELTSTMQSKGYQAEALHGDMRQAQRDKVMAQFRKGTLDILIATDVAARGIDVDDIDAVFNYDLPTDEEYYVHRIGRTGRAGKSGKAFSFVLNREFFKLKEIQRYTKSVIRPQKPPSLKEIEEKKINNVLDDVKTTIADGHLGKYMKYIEKMLEESGGRNESGHEITVLDIAAAFLKEAVGLDNRPANPDGYLENFENTGAKGSGMVRLFINAGRNNQIQPKHIIQGISARTGLPEKSIGAISIHDKFTFAEVPLEYAGEVLTSMKNSMLNGQKIHIEKAMARN
jgi:ATP-dependent RNA helicase DeaD